MSELWTRCPNLGHTTTYLFSDDGSCGDEFNSEPDVLDSMYVTLAQAKDLVQCDHR